MPSIHHRHIFSADIEEYFQVEAFSPYVKTGDWDKYPGRVEKSTNKLLELLDTHRVQGTFFILGWLAERNPSLVRKIASAGHEIGSHGFGHKMVTQMSLEEFREDIRKSKKILEDITGEAVKGYRAPTFSIVKETVWAYGVLSEEGYRYSSSVFPIWHDRYGWPEFGQDPKQMVPGEAGGFWEVPLSVRIIGYLKVPFGGGGYLRWYPLFLTKRLLKDFTRNGRSIQVYIHPWELDDAQPDVPAPFLRRFRHRMGIRRMEEKLSELFSMLPFGGVGQFLEENGYVT